MPHAAGRLTPRQAKLDTSRANAAGRGYDARWRKARLAYLARNSLCVLCRQAGLTVLAEVVDHIRPHRGDMVLFWNATNWQALCEVCHNAKTARGE